VRDFILDNKKLNVDVEWLRKILNWLTSKTFLKKTTERRYYEDGKIIPKPVNIYSYNKLQALIIPKWEELPDSSSNTTNTNITMNSSNRLNTTIVNSLNEVNEQKKDIIAIQNLSKFSDSQIKQAGYTREQLEEAIKE
jgi:hypothetical protein